MSIQHDRNIYNVNHLELTEFMSSWNEPYYRIAQVWEGLYKQLWTRPSEFTNLSKTLRRKLEETFASQFIHNDGDSSFSHIHPLTTQMSRDGETIKTLFKLTDGKQLEAVLMQYENRRTLCISTQAGCAMGCVFCATGQMGFHRHLSSGEIVEQVLYYARQLKLTNELVTNVVIMGMGEPFHNYESTMAAIERLNHPQGFNLGARRFTISTVGLVPVIRRFTQAHTQINLAISLHAAEDTLRSELLPINRKYPLDELFAACHEYIQQTHRRLTFEWALIQGVNDTVEQARALAQRLKIFQIGSSVLCHVNVIPLNPTRKYSGAASTRARALTFRKTLELEGIPCTIRLRRGIEIQAGCGQLAEKLDYR